MKNVVVFAAVLMTVGVFAGCLNTTPPRFTSVLEDTVIFDGTYHWAPIMRTDDQGNWLQNFSIDDPTAGLPRSFEAVLPFGGSQPAAGVVPNASGGPPTIFTVTWDDIQRSNDWGQTWSVAKRFVAENYPVVQDRYMTNGADMWVDDSGAIFVSQLYQEVPPRNRPPMSQCFELYRSLDGGTTWEVVRLAHCWPSVIPWYTITFGGSDDQGIGDVVLQHIVTGPPAAGGLSPATGPLHGSFKNNVYLCYSSDPLTLGTGQACAASFDGGRTFPQRGLPVKTPVECETMRAGRPAVTADGVVTMPMGWEFTPVNVPTFIGPPLIRGGFCDTPPSVAVSDDNTLTWEIRRYTEGGWINHEMNPAVAYTPDGTGYFMFRSAADQQVYLLRSTDQFRTWKGPPVRVSPKDITLTAFTAMVAGDDGKIAMAYLGTRQAQEPGAWSGNASGNSHWNLFLTTSFDAAADHPTFLTHQATPQEDPVQVGRIIPPFGFSSPLIGGLANLHNFIGLTADADGRLIVSFTDGCNARVGCTGDTDAGFWLKDRQGAVAIMDRGESIRGKMLESIGLTAPPPKAHADNEI